MDVYKKLEELNIRLPIPPDPIGMYLPLKQSGNLIYTAGAIPVYEDNTPLYTGKVGSDITLEQGQEAAAMCAVNILSRVQAHLKDLNRIVSVVKITGFVASAPGFNAQPQVINAASKMMTDIFGVSAGAHARSAVGVSELPLNVPVEVEIIFEVNQ